MATIGNLINAGNRGDVQEQSAFSVLSDILYKRAEEQRQEQIKQQRIENSMATLQRIAAKNTEPTSRMGIDKAYDVAQNGDKYGSTTIKPTYKLDQDGYLGASFETVDQAEENEKLDLKGAELGVDLTGVDRRTKIKTIAQRNAERFKNEAPEGTTFGGNRKDGSPIWKPVTQSDIKAQRDMANEDKVNQNKTEMVLASAQDTLDTIGKVKKNLKYFGAAGSIPPLPGEYDKVDWRANFDKLLSQKVLDVMTQLKDASKTGATGFGALSAPELKVLQDAATVLKPNMSEKDALEYLEKMEVITNKVLAGDTQSTAGGDVRAQYNALRAQGLSAEEAKKQLGL